MEDKTKSNLVCIVNDGTIQDTELSSVPQPFLIGSLTGESENTYVVEIELNQASVTKTLPKQIVKKIFVDPKDLDSADLSKVKEINPLDCLINITNRINSKKFFNLVDEGILVLYDDYSAKDYAENFRFAAINNENKVRDIFNNFQATLTVEQKNLVLSSLFKDFDKVQFDEVFLKIVDCHLKKSEPSAFFFLSNQLQNFPTKHHQNLKYLIKNLSLYQKAFYPTTYFDSESPNNSLHSIPLLDRLLSAVQLIEAFVCSSYADNTTNTMVSNPNLIYGSKIYYNRKDLVARSARLDFLGFNKFFLETPAEENRRIFDIFYSFLRGADQEILNSLDLGGKLQEYKILNKSGSSAFWETDFDTKNFALVLQALKNFNFSQEEVDHVYRSLAFIVHLGNAEFVLKDNEIFSIDEKTVKSVFKVLNVKNEKLESEILKNLVNKININQNTQRQNFCKINQDEARRNVKKICQDLYEKLINFILLKVNKNLFNEKIVNEKSLKENLFKEVTILDVSNNSTFLNKNTVFGLLHFHYSEKMFALLESEKITNLLKQIQNKNLSKEIRYTYNEKIENINKFFESFSKITKDYTNDQSLKESVLLSKIETNKTIEVNNGNLTIRHLDADYSFSLNGVLAESTVDINYNLNNILDIMINSLKTSSEDLLKIYLSENGVFNYFQKNLTNFNEFLKNIGQNRDSCFLFSLPQQCFEKSLDEMMTERKSLTTLNQIRKMRIESYVENVLNRFSRVMGIKQFTERYGCLIPNKGKDSKDFDLQNSLKILGVDPQGVVLDGELVYLKNFAFNALEEKIRENFAYAKNSGMKILSVLKMLKLKKNAATKIQRNFKKKLVEISKKYKSICEYKIHFWILARFKRLRMKKQRRNIIKIQRLVRSFFRRKIMATRDNKVDFKNWNLERYIASQEKLIKPKHDYGKFDIKNYVGNVIKATVSKTNKIANSEYIKEEQLEEIRKKNAAGFNPKGYLSSLITKVVRKIEEEARLEKEHKEQAAANAKKQVKDGDNVKDSGNSKATGLNKEKANSVKKEDLTSSSSGLKPNTQPVGKKPVINTTKPNPVKPVKEVQTSKKPVGKELGNAKKSDNLNIIREEIKAEDSEKREPSNEDKILKIQGKWKAKRASKFVDLMREKVFVIQRNFRKLLIRKYDLPDNYFYNEVFLRKQLEIFEKNVMENMKVLFPAIFENEEKQANDQTGLVEEEVKNSTLQQSKAKITKQKVGKNPNMNDEINLKTQSKLLTERSLLSTNLKGEISKNSLIHNPYEDGKIHLFANILDIDFMVETDEVYEKLWASSFHKIFTHCINGNAPLQLMSLGSSHTVCLNNKGKAYSFGWNNYGQCGVPVKSTIISKKELAVDSEVEGEKKRKGEYSVSKSLKVINKVEGMKIPQIEELLIAKSVACGEDHTLLLDHEGEVWCFGINLNGQLGLGHKNLVEKPSKLTSLSKLKISSIKTEGEVNFAVSSFGDAYMWPWNDKNKLRYDPLKISLKNEKVGSISCGNNFVLFLCASGKVYSMGKTNNYGQLGLGDTQPRYRPTLIEFFVINQERVTQVSCGYKHAACKTSTGRVYTWGLGVKGQLGHGDFNNYSLPHQIVFDNNPFVKGLQVACGFRSTFFLLENRKIYFSGCTSNTFMQNYPILYNYVQKIPELKNDANYSIVRILTTWTKSFSVLYATIADSTTMKISPIKLNSILTNLASKWDNEYVEPPYIEPIAGYFSCAYMKKSH